MELLVVNPASGDKSASLFLNADASSTKLSSIPTGTILKKTGSSSKYYEVEYDSGLEAGAKGGNGNTGTIVAYPTANVYKDENKQNLLSQLNNGTAIKITDSSNSKMFKVIGKTLDGNLEGYVESRFIYRDEEETPPPPSPAPRRLMAAPEANDSPSTGKKREGRIKATTGAAVYSEPSKSSGKIGTLNTGELVTVRQTKQGFHQISSNRVAMGWVSAEYVVIESSATKAHVPKADVIKVANTASVRASNTTNAVKEAVSGAIDKYFGTNTKDEYLSSNFGEIAFLDVTNDNKYYAKLIQRYTHALGVPPRFNMDIDIQYDDEILPGMGRVYSRTLLANPSILSICPGKVKMFPNMIGMKRDGIWDSIADAVKGDASLLAKMQEDKPGWFSDKLYAFNSDLSNYAANVNALCRSMALMLDIGDKKIPNTTALCKNFDYTYWTIRKGYDIQAAFNSDPDKSIFRNFWAGMVSTAKEAFDTAVDDNSYINFFLGGSETQVSESADNTIGRSPLEDVLSGVSSIASTINYFTGSGFDLETERAEKALSDAFGSTAEDGITGIMNVGKNLLKGGRIVLPDKLEGSDYGRSVTVSMRFVAPYGDKYCVFLKCLIPIAHLIALAFPKQVADNMYTYPYVIRAFQLGQFNIDLGVITNLTINRGGSDETSYSSDTLATEWDVSITITPLVNKMMLTSTKHPFLLMKNEAMMDYLSNMCGFDMIACNIDTKMKFAMMLISNTPADIVRGVHYKVTDTFFNKINRFTHL